jgi:hypothetical protein
MNYCVLVNKWLEQNQQARELPSMTMWYINDFADWLNQQAAQQSVQSDGLKTCGICGAVSNNPCPHHAE